MNCLQFFHSYACRFVLVFFRVKFLIHLQFRSVHVYWWILFMYVGGY